MDHGRGEKIKRRQYKCLCGAIGLYNDEYDAYYCPVSHTWLEDVCSDKNCEFCTKRAP